MPWPVVLLLSLLVSGLLVVGIARAIERQDRLEFELEVSQTLETIGQRVNVAANLLRGTRGLFDASEHVDADEFRRYVGALDLPRRYPGILGIGLTQQLAPHEVPALESAVRAAGRPDFQVWPRHARPEYHSIVYLEPMNRRNAAAIGFDMFTEPVRRAAMTLARERDDLVASGRVTLVQELDPRKQAGFLMYLPVRTVPRHGQRELQGFVYSPLRVDDLLHGTRGAGVKRVDYELYDGVRAEPEALLRSTRGLGEQPPAHFVADHVVDIPGRQWLVRFYSRPELDAASQRWLVPWLAAAAMLASLVLAYFTRAQERARRQAEHAARLQADTARAVAQERGWLDATLTSIADGVLAIDAGDRIRWMNPVAEDLTGWSREEAVGRTLGDVVHAAPIARDGVDGTADPARFGRGEVLLASRDGTTRPVAYSSAPIVSGAGEASGAVVVLRDVSEQYQIEAELRENDRRKDEFLAMLAHELRNPLAPISTASHLLKLSAAESTPVREASDVIARQVGHMTRLVDDLLDVSRVTGGLVQLERTPVDLRTVVATAVEQARPLVQARGHELRVQVGAGPFVVEGDFHRLVQVVSNLLNNAAKYTPQGGLIELRLGVDDGRALLSVVDNGVGIAKDMLDRVFDLFTQAERTPDRSQGGLGIGLSLVRSLVHLHQGEVRAESAGPGQGSAFHIMLPLTGGVGEAEPQARPTFEGASLRILIVDDNVDAAATLADVLRLSGHAVTTADDASSALAEASSAPFDAFILDIGLPDMTGYELAGRIRGLAGAGQATLIALTGYGQAHDRVTSKASGFDFHLVKPASVPQLLEILGGVRKQR